MKIIQTTLTRDQDETIKALEEMKDELYSKISTLQDEIDTINGVIVKFQTQILLSQTKWKIDEQN